jgi:hypothetical protein
MMGGTFATASVATAVRAFPMAVSLSATRRQQSHGNGDNNRSFSATTIPPTPTNDEAKTEAATSTSTASSSTLSSTNTKVIVDTDAVAPSSTNALPPHRTPNASDIAEELFSGDFIQEAALLSAKLRRYRQRHDSLVQRQLRNASSVYLRTKAKLRAKLSIEDAVKRIFNPKLITKLSRMKFREQLIIRWRAIMLRLLPLGGASEGNSVSVYKDGDSAYAAMWHAISTAQTSIMMETYILYPDEVGIKTMVLFLHLFFRSPASDLGLMCNRIC